MSKQGKKIIRENTFHNEKKIIRDKHSTDNEKIVWMFDMIDRNGKFAFDVCRDDFNHQCVLSKLIDYGNMSWSEIKKQTHDKDNKSKHHFLDIEKLSDEAGKRISALKYDDKTDAIFSLAFTNTLRIIGIREEEKFHIVWYDPFHEFCPSHKRT